MRKGDLLGLRVDSFGTGCYFAGDAADVAGDGDPSDPATGETRDFTSVPYVRANVAATFEDTVPPETTITMAVRGGVRAFVRLEFESSEPVARFECREPLLFFSDCEESDGSYEGQGSSGAKTFKLARSGGYSVRAVDLAGNVDPTPAVATFDLRVEARFPGKRGIVEKRRTVDNRGFQVWVKIEEEGFVCLNLRAKLSLMTMVLARDSFPKPAPVKPPPIEGSQCFPVGWDGEGAVGQAGAPAGTGSNARVTRCADYRDPCVLGKKLTLELRPAKRRHRRKIAEKLAKGQTVKVKVPLTAVDVAGNTESARIKVKLKPKGS